MTPGYNYNGDILWVYVLYSEFASVFPAQSHPVLMMVGWAHTYTHTHCNTHQCCCKFFLLPSITLIFSSIFDRFSSDRSINSQNTRFLAQMALALAHVVCIMHEPGPLFNTHTQCVS